MQKNKELEIDIFEGYFNQVPITYPLDNYKKSMEAVITTISAAIGFSKRQSAKLRRINEEWNVLGNEILSWEGYTAQTPEQLQKAKKEANGRWSVPNEEQLSNMRTELKETYDYYLKMDREFHKTDPDFEEQLKTTLPMYFIYAITIWDAFINDTTKRILSVHPHIITTSNKPTEISRSVLWACENMEEVRDYLLEAEVQKYDYDRDNLIRSFKEYWGIDWQDSGIGLSTITEFRSRRDIWVHNQGKVNRQYLEMLSKANRNNILKIGESAKIVLEYLSASINALTILAVFIHSKAHEKHYLR
mgnify:CR=1 FL=1